MEKHSLEGLKILKKIREFHFAKFASTLYDHGTKFICILVKFNTAMLSHSN